MFEYKVTFCLIFISLYAYAHGSKFKKSFPSTDEIPVCSTTLRSSPKFRLQEQYDIIILGAGAAGSLISAKLASNLNNMSILLVEAGVETGNNDNDNITNPALWLYVVHNDTLEWRFQTIPQTALKNRIIDLGFAKGTGGGAMHNAMGYVRGGQKW